MMSQQLDQHRYTVMDRTASALPWRHPVAGTYFCEDVGPYAYMIMRQNSHKWAVGSIPLEDPSTPWPILVYVRTAGRRYAGLPAAPRPERVMNDDDYAWITTAVEDALTAHCTALAAIQPVPAPLVETLSDLIMALSLTDDYRVVKGLRRLGAAVELPEDARLYLEENTPEEWLGLSVEEIEREEDHSAEIMRRVLEEYEQRHGQKLLGER
ncbi:hypothetical protein ACFXNW_09025 [Nocardia sp. NPDC059180]|uniref:hypothetical protein n=1 Tax=Nocardia sp. NPDC059180 TaxID=3346761 RepID=UPI0036972673